MSLQPDRAGPARAATDLAIIAEPRFSGGTSAALASELRLLSRMSGLRIKVHGVRSAMFGARRRCAPVLEDALQECALPLIWDSPHVSAQIAVLHNPSFLRHDRQMPPRISAHALIAITHENFLRPGGGLSYDVGHTLRLIEARSLAERRILAPVSPHNRATVQAWLARPENAAFAKRWEVLGENWFNICDFEMLPPADLIADRRGRLSRPGLEKFPPQEALEACFPPHAQSNVILGADNLLPLAPSHPHWQLLPFGTREVADFLAEIDFMIYFTAPTWRESFGRVIAEAIAAGKLVITDPETAAPFPGVLKARPDEVDALVARHVSQPRLYREAVLKAQAGLQGYAPAQFAAMLERQIGAGMAAPADAADPRGQGKQNGGAAA